MHETTNASRALLTSNYLQHSAMDYLFFANHMKTYIVHNVCCALHLNTRHTYRHESIICLYLALYSSIPVTRLFIETRY